MREADRPELVMMLRGFHDFAEGTRVQRHLLALDLHELIRWCDHNPETVERVS